MLRHRYRTPRRLSLQVLDDRRVLAAIVGGVFHDANDSLRRDSDETGLENRLVYVDQNQNAQMDQGEKFALTDGAGEFSIDGLSDGEYSVRLFSGTSSQVQTTPSSAEMLHDAVLRTDVATAVPAIVLDAGTPSQRTASAVLASSTSLQSVAADGTLSDPIDVGGSITHLSRLADGSLLVLSNTSDGGQAHLVDPTLSSLTDIGTVSTGLEIQSGGGDDLGRGLVVASPTGDSGQSELWSVDATEATLAATGVMVAENSVITSDSTPRTDDGPTRSVISHAALVDDGNGGTSEELAISLWSHSSASTLGEPIVVSGASEVVAFHDQSGLLVLRTGENLSVYDVDNHLASLYTIEDTESVAAIDGARGLIVALTSSSAGDTAAAGLRLIDSETGSIVADMPIDVTAVGDLDSLSLDEDLRSVVLAGSAGIAQITLRKPAAAQVKIAGGQAERAAFGVRLIGSNSAPVYTETPVISTEEDSILSVPLPAASDTDGGDHQIILPLYPPQFGTATIGPDGQIDYTPNADFEGTDTISILIGDGRDFTETEIQINVTPVPDIPSGVTAGINPVPENTPPAGTSGSWNPIGIVGVTDVDAVNNFDIRILDRNRVPDERFRVVDRDIIFVGPEPLDYETERLIPLIISVDDPDSGGNLEFLTAISIMDSDDPITDITPDDASVHENSPGEVVTGLGVVDQDVGQNHELSVDDDRFEIVSGALKLKDDVELDYEESDTITVNVTATHEDDSFTKAIELSVIDVHETPGDISLSNHSVLELQAGAVVGELTVDGNPAANGHSLTVNDSRFVIDGSTLRLADNTFLEHTPGVDDEILVEVTATPNFADADGVSEEFVIAVLENDNRFHNDSYPEDVNHADGVTAVDALTIINYLNAYGAGPVGEGDPAFGYDVNNDGFVTSLDALLVINELNAISAGATGTVNNEPSSEPDPNSDTPDASSRIANDPVVPVETQLPRVSPLRRSASQDLAIASLMELSGSKVSGHSSDSIDETVAVISIEIPDRHGDEDRADEVFGETGIDLLGS
ncbi:dockerin type I domain-containing protein [Allorhodopirellula solitaria]|uniref:Dockerin type I repeat protein n=1 Tax=Allorhodopirellula solitaria TaxID=2527987 RepID=A0A5C5WPC1_9BACT|nr:dockerin type I domain-containing protein [Allorhodopirellula solitaria]TWT52105.1 Dockerin type I repeat protein [Allorhodopirellula solitaria]